MQIKSRSIKRSGIIGLTIVLILVIVTCASSQHSSADSKIDNISDNFPVSSETVINGIQVPPFPDPKINNSTQAGIDSNSNGIRDDVERILVTEFGADKDSYEQALKWGKAQQNLIVKQDEASVAEYIQVVSCLTLKAKRTDKITHALLNTAERRNAYASLLVGRGGDINLECK